MSFNLMFNVVLIIWVGFLISQRIKENMSNRAIKIFVSILFFVLAFTKTFLP